MRTKGKLPKRYETCLAETHAILREANASDELLSQLRGWWIYASCCRRRVLPGRLQLLFTLGFNHIDDQTWKLPTFRCNVRFALRLLGQLNQRWFTDAVFAAFLGPVDQLEERLHDVQRSFKNFRTACQHGSLEGRHFVSNHGHYISFLEDSFGIPMPPFDFARIERRAAWTDGTTITLPAQMTLYPNESQTMSSWAYVHLLTHEYGHTVVGSFQLRWNASPQSFSIRRWARERRETFRQHWRDLRSHLVATVQQIRQTGSTELNNASSVPPLLKVLFSFQNIRLAHVLFNLLEDYRIEKRWIPGELPGVFAAAEALNRWDEDFVLDSRVHAGNGNPVLAIAEFLEGKEEPTFVPIDDPVWGCCRNALTSFVSRRRLTILDSIECLIQLMEILEREHANSPDDRTSGEKSESAEESDAIDELLDQLEERISPSVQGSATQPDWKSQLVQTAVRVYDETRDLDQTEQREAVRDLSGRLNWDEPFDPTLPVYPEYNLVRGYLEHRATQVKEIGEDEPGWVGRKRSLSIGSSRRGSSLRLRGRRQFEREGEHLATEHIAEYLAAVQYGTDVPVISYRRRGISIPEEVTIVVDLSASMEAYRPSLGGRSALDEARRQLRAMETQYPQGTIFRVYGGEDGGRRPVRLHRYTLHFLTSA